jgi:hypothetical protein
MQGIRGHSGGLRVLATSQRVQSLRMGIGVTRCKQCKGRLFILCVQKSSGPKSASQHAYKELQNQAANARETQ